MNDFDFEVYSELLDRVYIAMETGNTAYARQIMAEAQDDAAAQQVREDVRADYGVTL